MIFDLNLARTYLEAYDRRLLTGDELLHRLQTCWRPPVPLIESTTPLPLTLPEVHPGLYERLMGRVHRID